VPKVWSAKSTLGTSNFLYLYPVNGNARVGANGSTVGATNASFRVLHKRIMIAAAVYLLVLAQDILRAGHHAKATSFAFFVVNHYCSNYFCHDLFFICYFNP
jgi:hypothetical protein